MWEAYYQLLPTIANPTMPAISPESPPTPTPSDYKLLTNINDIRECLRKLDAEENAIDARLDVILDNRTRLEGTIYQLSSMKPKLSKLKSDGSRMVTIISGTSSLAERVSDKVRKLDLEQSRVKEAIHQVEEVQDLKQCITSMQDAMLRRDYDDAATLLHQSFGVDRSILEGSFAEYTVPTSENPDNPTKTISDVKAALFDIFSKQFDMAVGSRDQKEITRYFKLFPLIGCHKEGLQRYSNFVCGLVRDQGSDSLRLDKVPSTSFYADTITALFENVALIINQHQPMVKAHYGPGSMLHVIQRLQEETDTQSMRIFERYSNERKIDRRVSEIRTVGLSQLRSPTLSRVNPSNTASPSIQSPDPALANALLDPRELDTSSNELAVMSQRSALFHRFLRARAKEELEAIPNEEEFWKDTNRKQYDSDGLLVMSRLSKRVSDLLDSYLIMEEYLVRRSVNMAMSIDEYDGAVGETSSCVDDVFFILKKVTRRCISTAHLDTVTSMINVLIKIIESEYIGFLQRKMSAAFTGHEPGNSKAVELAKLSYMVVLNNLDVSSLYIQRLSEEALDHADTNLIEGEEYQRLEKALKQLGNMSDSMKKRLNAGLEQLFGQTLKPRVRPLFQEAYRDVKYVLDEDEYNEADSNDAFVRRFTQGFSKLIDIYRRTFTEPNFAHMLDLMVTAVTKQWEKIVLQTRFNQLGALRFDKDLRSLTHYLSNLTDWSTRDKMTRLNQTATVLNFETPSEIYEYWGSKAGPVTWRLTVTEIKKLMMLRIDLDHDEIANLEL
ncbi:hypothetical protein INT44_007296 [Umbelopsis vinacea]|uniref:Conserved oligomeric Golgi complex subunit 4 n=1 Tax=Umbelopsis vinacea TaxID=44442 RepID=A0A8H7UCM0_9FUNG|nr:hypothetical protein INT44_007296 [Umbelopsis vinacea]